MSPLRPIALRVGPLPGSGAAAIELELADGRRLTIDLDTPQASAVADRFREMLDGRICQRPPSRRVLEIVLGSADDPAYLETEPPTDGRAVVPDLEADRRTQGVL